MKILQLITFSVVLALSVIGSLSANDEKYTQAMQKGIKSIYNAKSLEEYQASINAFKRIASAENQKWEPLYYIAFGHVMISTMISEPEKMDLNLDEAMAALDKAKGVVADEPEVIALEGFIYMMRLTVDPATRGAQMAPLAVRCYTKALELNPENPRAVALLAQMQYGSAQFFGSSTDEACATGKRALQMFEGYASPNELAPTWGKQMAENFVSKCK